MNERDLPEASRLSKRLATAAITQVLNAGWVMTQPADGQRRMLSLTETGAMAADVWPAQLAQVDQPWVGTPLREALEHVVRQLPFELPHYPASYGSADPSAIGGPSMQNAKRRAGLPAHGTDWRPVPRGDGDTTSSLPITALLSQALTAFTIDYEDRFPWPLASTMNVLVHIDTTPTPLTKLPPNHGITGNGKSLLERHLIVSVTTQGASLTDRGKLVLERHPARLDATEATWREHYGDEAVNALQDALSEPAAAVVERPPHVTWPAAF